MAVVMKRRTSAEATRATLIPSSPALPEQTSSMTGAPSVTEAVFDQMIAGTFSAGRQRASGAPSDSYEEGAETENDTTTVPAPAPARTVADRWTKELVKSGHVAVARTFLRNYSKLNITATEAMFIIHLMDFKWTKDAPWPKYKRVAEYMGVSDKQVRRLAQSLEIKKLLRREKREARPNRFHLDGLFTALEQLKLEGKARK